MAKTDGKDGGKNEILQTIKISFVLIMKLNFLHRPSETRFQTSDDTDDFELLCLPINFERKYHSSSDVATIQKYCRTIPRRMAIPRREIEEQRMNL